MGQFFATIGSDNKFKIWQEDPSQQPRGGRRFSNVYSQSPPNHVSYVSFGFKSIKNETWLALMTHVGSLSLLEMADPESLASWAQIEQVYPFGQHHRGTEARFSLSFQESEGPAANAVMAGLNPRSMSLAVSAMNLIRIYRVIPGEASESNYQLCEVLGKLVEGALINEIAWAPGCLRPYDTIAAACDDGTVRMFLLDTPCNDENVIEEESSTMPPPQDQGKAIPTKSSSTPSGIGAGLAGLHRATNFENDAQVSLQIEHVMHEVAALPHDDGSPVWKVRWMHDGKCY